MDVMAWLGTAIDWMDKHNGLVQALGTGVAAFVAMAALIVALLDTRARTRPVFAAYLREGDSGLEIVVSNIGGSPARDVDLAYVDEGFKYRDTARPRRRGLPLWVHGLTAVYPIDRDRLPGKTLVIRYKGYGRRVIVQPFDLDLRSLGRAISPSHSDAIHLYRAHLQDQSRQMTLPPIHGG